MRAAQADPSFDAKKAVTQPGWQPANANVDPMIKMVPAYGNRFEGVLTIHDCDG